MFTICQSREDTMPKLDIFGIYQIFEQSDSLLCQAVCDVMQID